VSAPGLLETASALIPSLPASLACSADNAAAGAVRHVYATSVGDGPRTLGAADCLAGPDGLPLATASAGDGEFDKGL
jgi:hypothetical protein